MSQPLISPIPTGYDSTTRKISYSAIILILIIIIIMIIIVALFYSDLNRVRDTFDYWSLIMGVDSATDTYVSDINSIYIGKSTNALTLTINTPVNASTILSSTRGGIFIVDAVGMTSDITLNTGSLVYTSLSNNKIIQGGTSANFMWTGTSSFTRLN